MMNILLWASIYLLTMALGYALKQMGILRPGDRRVLSNLIFYVTLPAMLIAGFSEVHVDSWFAVSFLLGLAVNTLMLLAGTLASRKKPPELQALYTINCAGLNLGNLAIPYFQNFFPAGIPYLCMFDTGDSFFSLGTTYAIACTRLGQKSGSLGFRLKAVLRSLTRSVPFVTYLLMTQPSPCCTSNCPPQFCRQRILPAGATDFWPCCWWAYRWNSDWSGTLSASCWRFWRFAIPAAPLWHW